MNTQTPNHPSAPTSILLAIATLAHGGAETHVLSLAAELKRRGRRVAVASGGGALVPLLAARGIPHDRLPPLSRSPLALPAQPSPSSVSSAAAVSPSSTPTAD